MGLKGFVEGGLLSIVAGCSTHPLDLVKVRTFPQGETPLQPAFTFPPGSGSRLLSGGPLAVGLKTAHPDGVHGLYSVVSAKMVRQAFYSTTRTGLYDVLKQKWSGSSLSEVGFPVHKNIVSSLVPGKGGAAMGNPANLAMARMQADGHLHINESRNSEGVADALVSMVEQEGAASLWKGSGLTIQRAMVVTASELATYDEAKEIIIENTVMEDGLGVHITASCAAGLAAVVASNPIDVIRTRLKKMKREPGKEATYKGAIDCAMKTVRAEGPKALYKGFVSKVRRQGPFTVVLFVSLEQLRKMMDYI